MTDRLLAVIWDFDGTLVDTRARNLSVTRAIVERIGGRNPDEYAALRSLDAYEDRLQAHRHWRDFYRQELGLDDIDLDRAEASWFRVQEADRTIAQTYEGIPDVLAALRHIPHGIVSLNGRENIRRLLRRIALDGPFQEIVGNDGIPVSEHKPHPSALLRCIESMTGWTPGTVFYVGDHETDIECVHNANARISELDHDVRIVGISALYGPRADDSAWQAQAHFRAHHPHEILDLAASYS